MSESHKHHDHGHTHHAARTPHGALWGVFVLSFLYMFAEIIGGIVSGSLALLADAGHMAIDTMAIALGLFASWIARRPANAAKTYGYYRAEILAALINGATLVAISFFIFYEAWQRFSEPHVIQGKMMMVVAVGGLLVNLISLFLVGKQQHGNLNIRGVWLHLVTDTLGSVSAVAAAFFVMQFGWTLADPIISVAIGLLILYGSWSTSLRMRERAPRGCPRGGEHHRHPKTDLGSARGGERA